MIDDIQLFLEVPKRQEHIYLSDALLRHFRFLHRSTFLFILYYYESASAPCMGHDFATKNFSMGLRAIGNRLRARYAKDNNYSGSYDYVFLYILRRRSFSVCRLSTFWTKVFVIGVPNMSTQKTEV